MYKPGQGRRVGEKKRRRLRARQESGRLLGRELLFAHTWHQPIQRPLGDAGTAQTPWKHLWFTNMCACIRQLPVSLACARRGKWRLMRSLFCVLGFSSFLREGEGEGGEWAKLGVPHVVLERRKQKIYHHEVNK